MTDTMESDGGHGSDEGQDSGFALCDPPRFPVLLLLEDLVETAVVRFDFLVSCRERRLSVFDRRETFRW